MALIKTTESPSRETGPLSEAEKRRMLRELDKLAALPQTRSKAAMEAELKELRRDRRGEGHPHKY